MRSEGDFISINEWLLPFSWLYGLGVRLRNHLFDLGILKSKAYDIPVISVGNITVGGSGKTPHVEYLIRLLQSITQVAVLSRGYKRKTKGYRLATIQSAMTEIGDEPHQMKHKFPDVYVAVDNKRTRGIEHLTSDEDTRNVGVILLDDAFQHRYVKPGINILLVDYHRLIIYDKLLPAGRLREPLDGKNRADIVIITKCPKDLKPMEFRVLTKAMDLFPFQDLYFTTIDYGDLHGIFHKKTVARKSIKRHHVMLLTGIASPEQIMTDLKPHCRKIEPVTFGDHHAFTDKDIEDINRRYAAMPEPKIIITTEKDASRLTETQKLSKEVKQNIYTLPIHVRFMLDQEEGFNQKIIEYVRKNARNGSLAQAENDHKPQDGHHLGNRPGTISFRDC